MLLLRFYDIVLDMKFTSTHTILQNFATDNYMVLWAIVNLWSLFKFPQVLFQNEVLGYNGGVLMTEMCIIQE